MKALYDISMVLAKVLTTMHQLGNKQREALKLWPRRNWIHPPSYPGPTVIHYESLLINQPLQASVLPSGKDDIKGISRTTVGITFHNTCEALSTRSG